MLLQLAHVSAVLWYLFNLCPFSRKIFAIYRCFVIFMTFTLHFFFWYVIGISVVFFLESEQQRSGCYVYWFSVSTILCVLRKRGWLKVIVGVGTFNFEVSFYKKLNKEKSGIKLVEGKCMRMSLIALKTHLSRVGRPHNWLMFKLLEIQLNIYRNLVV